LLTFKGVGLSQSIIQPFFYTANACWDHLFLAPHESVKQNVQ